MKLSRILAVIEKETKEIVRDPVTVAVALLMPLVMLFLFGYAISFDVDGVAMGVLDHDRSAESRALVDRFLASGYFVMADGYLSAIEVETALQRSAVKLALIIPPGFANHLARGEPAPVQVLVDGTFSATANLVAAYAKAIIAGFGVQTAPPIEVAARVWYNPSLRSVNYVVPGLFGVILMAFPPLLTALAITREKQSGSIQQIFVSPLTPAEFLSGNLIPYGLIAFLQIVMVIAVGFLWFAVPLKGGLALLLGVGLVYVFTTVGIGLLVSTLTNSQLAAMLLALIISLMPSFLFSGFLFPIFTMPFVSQLYTRLFPAQYFVDFSRGVVLKGAGLAELWPSVLLLLAYTLVIFALAVWRFRKKVA
ncbi:ABC transporter permease [Aurantimonas sp. C2-6-R+9]|uniref:ABC transporter permease n=1 Tax=unclassified Aurantimonas TaxID=2638230 RepID=UPI002E18F26B|nr:MULTISPECIES: ABC transporter permease [unclassified Aurantimonas]MEC5292577.1 ABC transporter permease [Aurantimonas sp. C2-3-R2]MEC5382043.1 ABC transporter permease [Aurantimonas sp. C2-6-R+9]MEC5413633.1 ABC transporter permease [Aurantimonas sp. C2-4-R8]